MSRLLMLLLRLQVAPVLAGRRRRDDRGDVPGWVMVAVATVG